MASNMCNLIVRRISGFRRTNGVGSQLQRAQYFSTETNSKPETNDVASEGDTQSEPEDPEKKFLEEKEQFTIQIADLQDKYKRALAETENVRLRMNKQIQEVKLFGIQSFCKDLLEVTDVLGKATESIPPEEITFKNPHLKNLFEGLKMTETNLLKVYVKHGLNQINPPPGEKFDPNYHEALFEQTVEGVDSGNIAVVTKIGYQLYDRTIRPAQVGVSK